MAVDMGVAESLRVTCEARPLWFKTDWAVEYVMSNVFADDDVCDALTPIFAMPIVSAPETPSEELEVTVLL